MTKVKNRVMLDKLDSGASKSMLDVIDENRRLHKALAIAQEGRKIVVSVRHR